MAKWFRAKPGKAAVYESATDSWDPLDNPLGYLDDINWHSDLDYLEVAFRGSQTINHSSVTDNSNQGGASGGIAYPTAWRNSPYSDTHTLYTHNLGYIPDVIVQLNGENITPGYAVQKTNNGVRVLTVIITSTQIQLRETAWTWSGVNLPALSRTYDIIGLVKPNPSPPLSDLLIEPGMFTTGRGKIDSTRRYLRLSDGSETDILVTDGKTADASNGVVRTVTPAGVVRDDATFSQSAYNYDGSFGPSNINARSLSVADSATLSGTFTNIGVNEKMVVVDNGNVVIDSDVPMAKFIGSVSESNISANYPNFQQDLNVFWNASFIGGVTWGSSFSVHATWRPQEWSNNIVVASGLNPDANFIVGRVRANRVVNPAQIGGTASVSGTSNWNIVTPSSGFRNISVNIPQNNWLSANGTIILETSYMMRRTATFRLSGTNLILNLQQSVGGYSTLPYRGNRDEDFGSVNTEVMARLHRVGARITEGGSSPPPPGWGLGGPYNPIGSYNWQSQWRFDVEFLVGHV